MKTRLWLAAFIYCFYTSWPAQVLAVADPSRMVSIISFHGIARGCPIDEHHLLTSRHVGVLEKPQGPIGIAAMWSDGFRSGRAWTIDFDLGRDLALMQTEMPLTQPYAIAQTAPKVGESLTIAGYRFADRLQMRTITTKLLSIVAVHLVLDNPAESGFSGSCVLNSQNEVVGVFQWSLGTNRGVASAVYPPFDQVNWVPPQS